MGEAHEACGHDLKGGEDSRHVWMLMYRVLQNKEAFLQSRGVNGRRLYSCIDAVHHLLKSHRTELPLQYRARLVIFLLCNINYH